MFFSLKVTCRDVSGLSGTCSSFACPTLHCLQSSPLAPSHIRAGPRLPRAETYPHLTSSGGHSKRTNTTLLEVTKTCSLTSARSCGQGRRASSCTSPPQGREPGRGSWRVGQPSLRPSAHEGGGRGYLEEGTQLLGITPHPPPHWGRQRALPMLPVRLPCSSLHCRVKCLPTAALGEGQEG